jgi:phosphoenolpyruvate---glycerone phosphotransferase subunit DhaK
MQAETMQAKGVQTKKLINSPEHVVEEMLDGIIAAHPGIIARIEGAPLALKAVGSARPGKVGIVIGGGSGHEPAFVGYVGKGHADAVAIGHVFTSPTPDMIYEAARAASFGAGVLFMYGNYAGDTMNFDMAAELLAGDGIEVRTVRVADDVASAPPKRRSERRGIAGGFFCFKYAGAAADRMLSFDDVERIAKKGLDRTFTMGVALAPCSLPGRGWHFELGENEMEIGMGIHGEPGVRRGPLKNADDVADEMLDAIFAELPAKRGDRVAVLVNGLGATPIMELYIINRRVKQRLDEKGIAIHRTWVGNYCSSLEMTGASISISHLDDELITMLDHPARCVMFQSV